MIVKEVIAFKRGQDSKGALNIGMKEAYRLDPEKYLLPEVKEYLERNRLYHDEKIASGTYGGPIDPNFFFNAMDKIGPRYEGQIYINIHFTLEIDDYDDRSVFRKSFSKFLKEQADYMITGWKSDSLQIRETRKTIGKYFTKFDVTIEPRENDTLYN